ncbi:hypothetical protein [Acinetobacter haemolyticus]|uniref:hypothetical protein n=1 Tax=Acinetobacter haemolyticus TaxID=29430 RepID=UPI000F735F9E|nr:hypothetical protein [Acinetobacter haemolyticus]RSN78187.1 hypothetical protein EA769_02545 [Acinetobacter haemolyticus]
MQNNELDKIYNILRRKFEPSHRDMNILFYTMGAILISVIFFTDKSDPFSYQYILTMIGMVIIFILLVYNSIKAIPPLEMFLKLPITKFILTIFFSGFVVYSAAEVSIIINSIFKVSSSNFKITLSLGTFFYFLNHLVTIFFLYTGVIILGLLIAYILESRVVEKDEFDKEKNAYWEFSWNEKCWYLVVMLLFFVGLFHYKNTVIQEDALKYKVFRIALEYDFDSKHHCTNIDSNYTVLYLGSQQNQVLINHYYKADLSNLEEFMTSRNYINFKHILNNDKLIFDTDECIYKKSKSSYQTLY